MWANISRACRLARVSRAAAYKARDEDGMFRAAWDETLGLRRQSAQRYAVGGASQRGVRGSDVTRRGQGFDRWRSEGMMVGNYRQEAHGCCLSGNRRTAVACSDVRAVGRQERAATTGAYCAAATVAAPPGGSRAGRGELLA